MAKRGMDGGENPTPQRTSTLQLRNVDSLMSLKDKNGKPMPNMKLSDYLLEHNFKQLSKSKQDFVTGESGAKTISQVIAEMNL